MILAIAHQKGGVGKSTVAANLCVYLDAIALDLDYQQSVSLFALSRRNSSMPSLDVLTIKSIADLEKAIKTGGRDIVIDCGGFDSELNRLALIAADMIITPVGDSSLELHGLVRFGEIVKEINRSMKSEIKARTLLNRVHPFANASLETLRGEIAQIKTFIPLRSDLRDRADYKRAFSVGKSVGEFAPESAADLEMRALIKELAAIAAELAKSY
jgi:chromosome partitioning protein